ncbi:MAG: hypothetical protein LBI69_04475 [Puniceicoccales bacterium]|jgi:hypothetical protein|nr:hypothetical protein [Puniceicoccales bacterium]
MSQSLLSENVTFNADTQRNLTCFIHRASNCEEFVFTKEFTGNNLETRESFLSVLSQPMTCCRSSDENNIGIDFDFFCVFMQYSNVPEIAIFILLLASDDDVKNILLFRLNNIPISMKNYFGDIFVCRCELFRNYLRNEVALSILLSDLKINMDIHSICKIFEIIYDGVTESAPANGQYCSVAESIFSMNFRETKKARSVTFYDLLFNPDGKLCASHTVLECILMLAHLGTKIHCFTNSFLCYGADGIPSDCHFLKYDLRTILEYVFIYNPYRPVKIINFFDTRANQQQSKEEKECIRINHHIIKYVAIMACALPRFSERCKLRESMLETIGNFYDKFKKAFCEIPSCPLFEGIFFLYSYFFFLKLNDESLIDAQNSAEREVENSPNLSPPLELSFSNLRLLLHDTARTKFVEFSIFVLFRANLLNQFIQSCTGREKALLAAVFLRDKLSPIAWNGLIYSFSSAQVEGAKNEEILRVHGSKIGKNTVTFCKRFGVVAFPEGLDFYEIVGSQLLQGIADQCTLNSVLSKIVAYENSPSSTPI